MPVKNNREVKARKLDTKHNTLFFFFPPEKRKVCEVANPTLPCWEALPQHQWQALSLILLRLWVVLNEGTRPQRLASQSLMLGHTAGPRAWWVHGRLQDQELPGPWSLQSLTCNPPWTAAGALWTFTFPLIKLKTRHITKLRASKISGGKHYWEQKPGRLFSRGWLLFQSGLASIFFFFFPRTGILGYWGTKVMGDLSCYWVESHGRGQKRNRK